MGRQGLCRPLLRGRHRPPCRPHRTGRNPRRSRSPHNQANRRPIRWKGVSNYVALAFETAIAEGWNINLSSGAVGFKRNRGGQPIMEYNATYHRHLSRGRRLALSTLAGMANVVGAPLMKRFEV